MLAWRRRGCFKKTAFMLAIVTLAHCNFATFLTRSGIFSSVHAFSESPVGWMFLVLMGGLLAAGIGLLVSRRSWLAGSTQFGSPWSRESLIAASVLLLVLFTVVVLVGTLVTPLSKIFHGRTIQIGPAFYNNVLAPIALLLLAMTAVVPLLPWGGPPKPMERRLLWLCIGLSLVVAAGSMVAGAGHPLVIGVVALAGLTAISFVAAWLHDARRRATNSLGEGLISALRNGRHKYAAYSVHVGMALVALGITASSLGSRKQEAILAEGELIHWAGRTIRHVQLRQSEQPDKLVAEAILEVAREGQRPIYLRPARHLHLLQNEWTTEVAIHSTWSGDFYTILHAGLGQGTISLTLIYNPLVRWIWVGGILAGASAIVTVFPWRNHRRAERDEGDAISARVRLATDSVATAA
jgi:cytochrome c-type biogenesis protein CcmF